MRSNKVLNLYQRGDLKGMQKGTTSVVPLLYSQKVCPEFIRLKQPVCLTICTKFNLMTSSPYVFYE
jgi:hypothetical protein